MLQVKMQKVADNPFFGKSAMKVALNSLKSASSISQIYSILNQAWEEAKHSKELRECFYIICFSVAEISNRQHNIFGKQKVDNGGNACRKQGMWILSWIRKYQPVQYYKFMFGRVINEFISFFAILASQIRTVKGKRQINFEDTTTYNALQTHDLDKVAEFLAQVITKGSVIDKIMLAKWLVIPRTSSRKGITKSGERVKRGLQDSTKAAMAAKESLYLKLSRILGWEVIKHRHNWEFVGLKLFRKEYNQSLESVLFSTKAIVGMDKEQFFNLLNSCPAGARYRIRRRLLDRDNKSKGKWISKFGQDFAHLFLEWEKFKETKQQEERELTEKVRQGDVSEETKAKLEKVKKEAKVTVGGTTLKDELETLMSDKADDKLIHSLLNKINFEVPVLVVSDISGSMSGRPSFIATMLTTVAMLKNPSNEVGDLLVTFGNSADIYEGKSKVEYTKNRFLSTKITATVDLVDRTAPFSTNFNNIRKFTWAKSQSTNLGAVSGVFRNWIEEDAALREQRIEHLQMYPVILVISDGDINNDYNAKSSMAAVQNVLAHYGWNGVIVVWNVKDGPMGEDKFAGLQNVVHYYGYNLGIINQIFTNIHDLEVIDVYSELKSLWLSNRYTKIKELVD